MTVTGMGPEMIGIPFSYSEIDETQGFYEKCPICGTQCFPPQGARTEDEITKGAARTYATHWQNEHASVEESER